MKKIPLIFVAALFSLFGFAQKIDKIINARDEIMEIAGAEEIKNFVNKTKRFWENIR